MVSVETKLRAANLFLNMALFTFKPSLDRYGYEQRKSFLNSYISLLEKAQKKSERAGYPTKSVENLLNYTNFLKPLSFKRKYGFNPPTFFAINPTNACDKKCYGCYAGELDKSSSVKFEILDKLMDEAKEIGIHFITVIGGEPFFDPDSLKLFEKHRDITFLVYTHGQYLAGGYPEKFIKAHGLMQGEELVKKLAELGNVHPAISQEGYRKETDARRGEGTYNNIVKARKFLNKYGIVHGASLTVTSLNFDTINKEQLYVDLMEQGCDFFWLFDYIPIGRDPDIRLMLTPEQRFKLAELSIHIRKKYNVLFADFRESAGDAQRGRCMIAGRGFLNIDGSGNIAPCVFVPYYVDNVNELYEEFYIKENKKKLETLLEDIKISSDETKKIILKAYNGIIENWDNLRIIPYALSRGMFVEMRLAQEKLLHSTHGKIHGSCVCSVLDHSKDVLRTNLLKWKACSSDNQPSLTENQQIISFLDKQAEEQSAMAKTFRENYAIH